MTATIYYYGEEGQIFNRTHDRVSHYPNGYVSGWGRDRDDKTVYPPARVYEIVGDPDHISYNNPAARP